MNLSAQEAHLQQARASLQQALSWYASVRRHWNYPPNTELQGAVRQDLQSLKAALDKIEHNIFKIATFGLVSRGKSAVINALLGHKQLSTGPLHGVTAWPQSVRWTIPTDKLQVELIDTPGLDEIAGEGRAEMAQTVAADADLILFVVAGDLTRVEYHALRSLRRSHKPLILVFNKIDLYPETDRHSIYQQLIALAQKESNGSKGFDLSEEEIVCVAAEPQPMPVREEFTDGTIKETWETPSPQIEALQQKILTLLNREGRSLLAINALVQAQKAEANIAHKTLDIRQAEAEALIWNYAKYKALIIAANPIAFLDLIGGFVADLALIRALARLYGLPITSHEASKLWRTILISGGSLLMGQIASGAILGLGKSAFALAGALDNPTAFTTYASTALLQGAIAGYMTYTIGKAAQSYLSEGCSWGALGPSSVIESIVSQIDPQSLTYRLRQDLINNPVPSTPPSREPTSYGNPL